MAPAKTSSKTKAKTKNSSSLKSKSKTIQPKARQFTVRGLTPNEAPRVEPLIEDEGAEEMNVPVKHLTRSEVPSPVEMDVPPPPVVVHQPVVQTQSTGFTVQPVVQQSVPLSTPVSPANFTIQQVSTPPHMEIKQVPPSSYDDEAEEEDIEEEPYIPSLDIDNTHPRDTIKVKFGKFVQLVNSHDFADVVTSHSDEEIIMSTDLLTELAGSHDRREERKIPLVFLVGIAIGVVLTYIFFSK